MIMKMSIGIERIHNICEHILMIATRKGVRIVSMLELGKWATVALIDKASKRNCQSNRVMRPRWNAGDSFEHTSFATKNVMLICYKSKKEGRASLVRRDGMHSNN
jgi:hypothetical protein